MGQTFFDQVSTWAGGLYTAAEPDRIPENSFPNARNNALYSTAEGQAIPGKRLGMGQPHITTPLSSGAQITGQTEFRQVVSGSVNKQHINTTTAGTICVVDANGAILATVSGWTPSVSYPDFESASNLLFLCDGTSAKKWTGTALQEFGITRPTDLAWGTPADATSGSMPANSTYELAITYYNSATGHESSRSIGKSVTTANDGSDTHRITCTFSTPSDTQVDKVRFYIRKTSPALGPSFALAQEVASNAGTVTLDLTDFQINNLVTAAPGLSTNEPPPTGIRYLALHEGRMFVSDGSNVYYSQINKPEAFSSANSIAGVSRDGQAITGLHAVGGSLLIFKQDSVWQLYGSSPQSWQVRLLIPDIGCVSHRSIVTVEGVTFWWAEQGPMAWDEGMPDPIGKRLITTFVHPTAINFTNQQAICAAADTVDQKIHFAIPLASSSRADVIYTFNYRIGRWEGINDPMDVASFGVAEDGAGRPWVFIGSYNGLLFKCGIGNSDGLPTGSTHTGTFVASASTQTSIQLTGGILPSASTFPTTNGGVVERKITVVDSNGRPTLTYRARITANTTDTLTIEPAIGNLTVGSTYTVYVAAPDWLLDTIWHDSGAPFVKKRYEWLYTALRAASSATRALVDVFTDFSATREYYRSLEVLATSTGGSWGSAIWGTDVWAGLTTTPARRTRLATTGQNIRIRFRHHKPNETIALLHLGFRGEHLRDKR